MKRIFIWVAVVIAPTLAAALGASAGTVPHRLADRNAAVRDSTLAGHGTAASAPKPLTGSPILLVPVRPPRSGPSHPLLRVRLVGNAGMGLLVGDPHGRHAGIEPTSHAAVRGIAHATVKRVLSDGEDGDETETVTVSINRAASTHYTLTIAGRQAGSYRLIVLGVSPALIPVTNILNGRLPQDTSLLFRVDLRRIRTRYPPGHWTIESGTLSGGTFVSAPRQSVIEPTDPKLVAAAAVIAKDPCGYFYSKLRRVPHNRLTRKAGRLQWYWDDTPFTGCQVKFVTHNGLLGHHAVPGFNAYEGDWLYRLGWRMDNNLVADGPDGGEMGIENGSLLCLIAHHQPGEFHMTTHTYTESAKLTITVQCRKNHRLAPNGWPKLP